MLEPTIVWAVFSGVGLFFGFTTGRVVHRLAGLGVKNLGDQAHHRPWSKELAYILATQERVFA